VLQVEAMAQLGGIVMMDPEDQAAKKNFFFGGIERCKFRRPVVPGDTLVSIILFVLRHWLCC
jgi:3-hydroxyacyl-[acyl-carrier-protein] dehydratase